MGSVTSALGVWQILWTWCDMYIKFNHKISPLLNISLIIVGVKTAGGYQSEITEQRQRWLTSPSESVALDLQIWCGFYFGYLEHGPFATLPSAMLSEAEVLNTMQSDFRVLWRIIWSENSWLNVWWFPGEQCLTAQHQMWSLVLWCCFSAAVAYKDIMDNFIPLKMWLQFGDWSSLLPYYSTPVHQSPINRWVSEFGVESSEPNWKSTVGNNGCEPDCFPTSVPILINGLLGKLSDIPINILLNLPKRVKVFTD